MLKRVLLALAIGLIATGLFIGLSFAADAFGFPAVAGALFWQNTLLQMTVPPINIGTATEPMYEASPLMLLAFLTSIPLGVIVYGTVAYAWLARARRRVDGSPRRTRVPRPTSTER